MAVVTISTDTYNAVWCARCGTPGVLIEDSSKGEIDCPCLPHKTPLPNIWRCWRITIRYGPRTCFQRGLMYRIGTSVYSHGR